MIKNKSKQEQGYWFEDEVKKPIHMNRIGEVLNNRDYLIGKHKILNKPNAMWQGEEFKTCKLLLQEAKTILKFHVTYLLGKRPSITGTEKIVKELNKVYRKGNYHKVDFNLLDSVLKYGDAFEYIYYDNYTNKITSKIINTEDSYPIYDDNGDYVGFVEYWTNDDSKISYYNVYSENYVERYSNEGGEIHQLEIVRNLTGLPIHYTNRELGDVFGVSEIKDIKPILDLVEEILSKMTDAVYQLSLNPIPIVIGQEVEGTIDTNVVGQGLNLEVGSEFNFANAEMDSNTIKLLLDTLHKKLEVIAGIPSVAMGNTNVANVSEVSLNMLYSLSAVKAMFNEQFMREGMLKRYEVIQMLLERYFNINFDDDDYIDIEFNYNTPINTAELIENLKKLWEMGAISIQTIIEKSNINDVGQELERLEGEKDTKKDSVNVDDIVNVEGEEVDSKVG